MMSFKNGLATLIVKMYSKFDYNHFSFLLAKIGML